MHPVCKMLHEAMRKLVDERYDGNIRKAAKYIHTDYNVAYRLYHGQQRSLDFFEALRLSKAIGLCSDGSALREYFTTEFEILGELASDPDAYGEIMEALDFAIASPLRYEVLLHASEIEGASMAYIEKEFGKRGLQAAEELLSAKVIKVEADGSLSSIYSQELFCSQSFCLSVANRHLAMLRLDKAGSYIRNHWLALNREGWLEYYKAHRAFGESMAAIENNPKFAGDEILVSGIFMGPISSGSRDEGDQQ